MEIFSSYILSILLLAFPAFSIFLLIVVFLKDFKLAILNSFLISTIITILYVLVGNSLWFIGAYWFYYWIFIIIFLAWVTLLIKKRKTIQLNLNYKNTYISIGIFLYLVLLSTLYFHWDWLSWGIVSWDRSRVGIYSMYIYAKDHLPLLEIGTNLKPFYQIGYNISSLYPLYLLWLDSINIVILGFNTIIILLMNLVLFWIAESLWITKRGKWYFLLIGLILVWPFIVKMFWNTFWILLWSLIAFILINNYLIILRKPSIFLTLLLITWVSILPYIHFLSFLFLIPILLIISIVVRRKELDYYITSIMIPIIWIFTFLWISIFFYYEYFQWFLSYFGILTETKETISEGAENINEVSNFYFLEVLSKIASFDYTELYFDIIYYIKYLPLVLYIFILYYLKSFLNKKGGFENHLIIWMLLLWVYLATTQVIILDNRNQFYLLIPIYLILVWFSKRILSRHKYFALILIITSSVSLLVSYTAYQFSYNTSFAESYRKTPYLSKDEIRDIMPVISKIQLSNEEDEWFILTPNRAPYYWLAGVFLTNNILSCDNWPKPLSYKESCDIFHTGDISLIDKYHVTWILIKKDDKYFFEWKKYPIDLTRFNISNEICENNYCFYSLYYANSWGK